MIRAAAASESLARHEPHVSTKVVGLNGQSNSGSSKPLHHLHDLRTGRSIDLVASGLKEFKSLACPFFNASHVIVHRFRTWEDVNEADLGSIRVDKAKVNQRAGLACFHHFECF